MGRQEEFSFSGPAVGGTAPCLGTHEPLYSLSAAQRFTCSNEPSPYCAKPRCARLPAPGGLGCRGHHRQPAPIQRRTKSVAPFLGSKSQAHGRPHPQPCHQQQKQQSATSRSRSTPLHHPECPAVRGPPIQACGARRRPAGAAASAVSGRCERAAGGDAIPGGTPPLHVQATRWQLRQVPPAGRCTRRGGGGGCLHPERAEKHPGASIMPP